MHYVLFFFPIDHGEPSTLPAGRREFPFSFRLPEETLATSFQGKHGSIRYWVEVKLQQSQDSVTEIRREFTFIEYINVNTPALQVWTNHAYSSSTLDRSNVHRITIMLILDYRFYVFYGLLSDKCLSYIANWNNSLIALLRHLTVTTTWTYCVLADFRHHRLSPKKRTSLCRRATLDNCP